MLEYPTSTPSTHGNSHATRASASSLSLSHRPSRDNQRVKFSIVGTLLSLSMLLASCTPPVPTGPGTLTVIFVNSLIDAVDANPGDNICADAQNKCTLRAAIMESNVAEGVQTINILAGKYLLTLAGVGEDGSKTGDLDITSETSLIGADASTTIIDANGLDRVFDSGRLDRNSIAVTAKNITVRGGTASDSGGGWIGVYTNLTLENVTFSGNTSTGDGGGLYVESGTTSLMNVRFESNTAGGSGGGMANRVGEPVIKNSSFTKNTARGENDGRVSEGGGGGLYSRSKIEISASTFVANIATTGWGGGILAYDTIGISASNVSGNEAQGCGGGLALNHPPFFGATQSSNLSVTSTSLTANTATRGAGLCTDFGTANFVNMTVSGNKASDAGGGILAEGTNVSMTHSTLAENTALLAGGRDIYASSNASVVVRASVLASTGGACATSGGTITSTGGNVASDASCAFSSAGDLQNTNPLLGVLTAVSNKVFSVRIPASNSPAVDRVPAGLCLSTDARGVTRPQGVACDSGAVERTTTDP
jgi:CSLREA domain-containing protein